MFVDSSLKMNTSFFPHSTGTPFHNLVNSKILPPSVSLLNLGHTP